jgi:hypothetical protein
MTLGKCTYPTQAEESLEGILNLWISFLIGSLPYGITRRCESLVLSALAGHLLEIRIPANQLD